MNIKYFKRQIIILKKLPPKNFDKDIIIFNGVFVKHSIYRQDFQQIKLRKHYEDMI